MEETQLSPKNSLRKKLFIIIFGTDTRAGKIFDIIVLYAILLSVMAVMIESVEEIQQRFGDYLTVIEWFFTIIFTIEYIARLYVSEKPLKYALSFLGFIDLFSIIPTYLTLFVTGTHFLIVIRTIRLLRVFRILKLTRYLSEAKMLGDALKSSRYKIFVFMLSVFSLQIIAGTLMYLIEGAEHGFTSIPRSIYWAIVTLTTVGYGDIAPGTVIGQLFASVLMIMGYAILAVPTGIVTSEITKENLKGKKFKVCENCFHDEHEPDSRHCKMCGSKLDWRAYGGEAKQEVKQ
ncbi:MAG: ion transporter [Cyclobacteriaceae bacterium]